MQLSLYDCAIAITGSSRGIGRACALKLADEGANVGLSGRTAATLNATVADITQRGRSAHAFVGDLIAPGGVEAFIDGTARTFGRLDGLVCSLGGTVGGNFMDTEADAWLKTFELNVVHTVRAIRCAVPFLEKSEVASVTIIASISGSKPGPRSQYGISKAAEISLARSLARELAPKRIRVNTVSPGSIMWEGGSWHQRTQKMPEKIAAFIDREFPWGRMGTLDEISDVVAFMASPRARWVNGTDLVVDGAQGNPSIQL